MNRSLAISLVSLCVVAAGCGKADGDVPAAAQSAAEAAGAPSASEVSAAQAAGAGLDTGGRVHMDVAGKQLEMTDVSYCVQNADAGGTTMSIFVVAANNAEWAINMTGMNGMPENRVYTVDQADMKTIRAGLTDKTTGKSTSDWQQYDATTGSITIASTDGGHVKGSFDFSAKPKYPKADGPLVPAKGDFDATLASSCK